MSKARELAELSRTVADSADAVAITVDSNENTTFTGVVTANAGVVVDNITIDGTTLALSSGDLTLDVAGDINLDSDSGYVLFKDAGTEHARIYQNNSGDVNIASQISDKDMKFNGNDGGTGITALTLDMSAAGAATFNSSVTATSLDISGDIDVDGVTNLDAVDIDGAVDMASTLTVATKTTTNELELTAIAQSKSDTAVDVFVYDTSKDSDGGAWRHRTQHTSWYNETLNTSTRGARKEFPCVAVIVAESNKLTIYDGDDPSMPMWMVFNTNINSMLRSGTVGSCVMINGELWVGTTAADLHVINVIKDISRWVTASSAYGGTYSHGGISQRNQTATYGYYNAVAGINDTVTVNANVNDIAVTVLPNAPIDADTGLPVPTIAVATNGGVSVIKDDGTVVDITSTSHSNANQINFTKENQLSFYNAPHYSLAIQDIPTSDETGLGAIYTNSELRYSSYDVVGSPNLVGDSGAGSASCHTHTPDYQVVTGSASGMTSIQRVPDAPLTGLSNYITSDYNTGWMNGDIKLATLSDTDTTNVTGSELVTNGTFASNVNSWTSDSGTPSYYATDSSMKIVQNIGVGFVYQAIPTVVGKTYTLSVDAKGGNTNAVAFFVGSTYNGGTIISQSGVVVSSSSYTTLSGTFVATTTTTYIRLSPWASATNFAYFDNVSVRLAEQDRSVNGKGLQVFGTVTKSAVATGADLVGYSGFSSSNYLEQPSNPDITSLTSFAFTGWFKTTMTGNGYLFSLGGGGVNARGLAVASTGGVLYTWDPANGQDLFTKVVNDGSWHQVTFIVTPTTRVVYIDGVLDSTIAVSVYTTPADSQYRVGVFRESSGTINNIFDGQHALQRFSATIPTAEQIKKMYNDEKHLFQENAQATLYGTSDAVTALAYDDDTELLHAGTSAGRSVFQGLRRVDNTTDAVGAAISASNDLVVEE